MRHRDEANAYSLLQLYVHKEAASQNCSLSVSYVFFKSTIAGKLPADWLNGQELLKPCQGGSHVARLNFRTSCVGVHKCLSFIVRFAVTVAIWPREVVSCHDLILHAVATFSAMSLVGIYPGRASLLNYEI